MDWRLAFIIILTFVIFIGMGKNPFAPPEGYVPRDEFKEGIQDKLSGQNQYGFGAQGFGGGAVGKPFGGPGGNTYAPPGTDNTGADPTRPADINAGGLNAYGGGSMPVYGYPNAASDRLIPVEDPAQRVAPQPTQPAPVTNPDSSNPFGNLPRPGTTLPAPQRPATAASPTPKPASPYVLQTGEPVYFEGTRVYTLNANGEPAPLPDGSYTLQNGTPLVIQGGNQVAQKPPF